MGQRKPSARYQHTLAMGFHPEKGSPQASCILLNDELDETDEPAIVLGENPTSWGKSRDQVTIWIDDEALADVHCVISLSENGQFVLNDNHTELGTWHNFIPVPLEGKELQHGDVFQVGDFQVSI